MIGNSLLLADYCLLGAASLGLDASLCCHPHHKAMVFPRYVVRSGSASNHVLPGGRIMCNRFSGSDRPTHPTSTHPPTLSNAGAKPPGAGASGTAPWGLPAF